MVTKTRLWIGFAVAYAVASLLLLNRLAPQPASVLPPPAPPATAAASKILQSEPIADGGSAAGPGRAFSVPHAGTDWSSVSALDLCLRSRGPTAKCTVQVQAVTDSHHRYAHTYTGCRVGKTGSSFHVPLRDSRGYWLPESHDGEWSDWETVVLRSVQVRVYPEDATPADILLLECVLAAAPASPPPELRWALPLADSVPLGNRFELAFDFANAAGNPFDPAHLAVFLRLTPPSGTNEAVRAFLYQSFDAKTADGAEQFVPQGPKHWRARYRPREAGRHAYTLSCRLAKGPERVLSEGTFLVSPGVPPDFIRVSAASPIHFQHADGRFFYPLGWSVICPSDLPHGETYVPYLPDPNSLRRMKGLLDDLAASGGNCTRLWFTDWWCGLEWNGRMDNYAGLGRYNLKNAWLADQLLDHCERRGIRAILETMNHLSTRPRDRRYGGAWADNPHNVENGGALRSFTQFWEDPGVLESEKKRLTYLIARYADSPAIHSWNYVSEADLASQYNSWPRTETRLARLTAHMRDQDPYRHIRSCHVSDLQFAQSLSQRPEFNFLQSNAYASRAGAGILSEEQVESVRIFSERCADLGKPALITEYGGRWLVDLPSRRARDIRSGLWTGIASQLAGTPFAWWWNFIYGEDMGRLWRVAAAFLEGEDLAAENTGEKGFWRNRASLCLADGGSPHATMVGNRVRRFAYLFNAQTVCRDRAVPTVCRNAKLRFRAMAAGSFVAEFWNPDTGRAGTVPFAVSDDGQAEVAVPDFTHDWAVKIRPDADPIRREGPVGDGTSAASPKREPAHPRPAPPTETPAIVTPPAEPSTKPDWKWLLWPLLPVLDPRAAPRCVFEVFIALPRECAGSEPTVTDNLLHPVPFRWTFLDGRQGWQIQIPTSADSVSPLFQVFPVPSAPVPPGLTDENLLGLELAVCPSDADSVGGLREFASALKASPVTENVRVGRVEAVENPSGPNNRFVARYRGPLFVPRRGPCRFGTNSDDGSILSVDDRPAAVWPGRHDMEQQNSPMVNFWYHTGMLDLAAGVHWMEYYHHQFDGAMLARAGWVPPLDPRGMPEYACFAFPLDTSAPDMQTIEDAFLDGHIPCIQEVRRGDAQVAFLTPCRGLRLRRPRKDIVSLGIRPSPKSCPWSFPIFETAGWTEITVGSTRVPVWPHARHWRPFSLEIETPEPRDTEGRLRTMTYDLECSLSLQVGQRKAEPQRHVPRQWVTWPLAPSETNATFTLCLDGVPLVSGNTGRWMPACLSVSERRQAAKLRPPTTPPIARRWILCTPDASPACLSAPVLRARLLATAGAEEECLNALAWDLWSEHPADFASVQEATAVIFLLDRHALVRGIPPDEVYRRLSALCDRVAAQGGTPILSIGPDVDLASPLQREQALALARVRDEFGCRLADLREPKP